MKAVDGRRVARFLGACAITVVCGIVGFMVGALHITFSTVIEERPAAHRVPPRPEATPLSMALVYDTLHGLHPEHGPAWHEAVVRRARPIVDGAPASGPVDAAALDAHDDLAVALDRLGRPDEGLAVLAQKWTRLAATWPEPPAARGDAVELTPDRRAWYRAYANRGTLRIHRAFGRLMAAPGDAEARADVDAGLADIRRSIALNPAAHFGRERWQAWIVTALLHALEAPALPRAYDLIGLRDDSGPLEPLRGFVGALPTDAELAAGLSPERREAARERVPHYAPDADWAAAVGHPGDPIPFDAPALAIVGMWLYGGGPNPHFALLLGRLMERVDQPVIAWSAYARAAELADRLGPLRGQIEPQIEAASKRLATALGQTEDELQAAFEAERARGDAYREAQAAFEASLADPLAEGALKPFFESREAIRTPPGQSDRAFISTSGSDGALILAWVLWCAALGAWLAAGRLRASAGASARA